MIIWFDMDGTFVDLYGVENWLEKLQNHNEEPYKVAKPLFNMNSFARCLNCLQRKGYKIGVISWLSKETNNEYAIAIRSLKHNFDGKYTDGNKIFDFKPQMFLDALGVDFMLSEK